MERDGHQCWFPNGESSDEVSTRTPTTIATEMKVSAWICKVKIWVLSGVAVGVTMSSDRIQIMILI